MTNIYHPTPVNQFYRLDRDTPTSPLVKTTPWDHKHNNVHGQYIDWDGLLCMCGEGAVALDAHTQGRIRVSPGAIHDKQFDNEGGIGVDDVKVAWQRGWNQFLLTPDDYDWNDLVYAVKVEFRHALLGVDYDHVAYDYQVQKTGSFDHAIGIDDFRVSDSRILRYDTLDTKAVWAPQSAYRYGAEALAIRVRGTRSKLFVALTARRPLLSSIPRYKVVIDGNTTTRRTPLYLTPNGTRAGAISDASYIVTRSKVGGLWWFQIVSGLGGATTQNKGKWFKPNSWMKFTRI